MGNRRNGILVSGHFEKGTIDPVSDEFLGTAASAHRFSIDQSIPCWMEAAEADWRTGVAAAMDAFRACKGNDDEPVFLFVGENQGRSLESLSLHPHQQIRQIQDWMTYLGDDSDNKISTSEGGYYVVDSSFQFP